jgi:DNA-binding MarR family transcriptional regulator
VNPSARTSSLSPQDRTACARFYSILQALTDLDPKMTALLAKVFLRIAIEDGLTGTDIAARTNVAPSVTTRHLKALGAHGGGLGLVQFVQGPLGDRRQKHVALTPKGLEVIRGIVQAFKTGAWARGDRMVRAMGAERAKDGLGVPAKTAGPL